MKIFILTGIMLFVTINPISSQTVALWLFDEQIGIYPSCVLNDASENDYPMVIGPGGRIVEGKFGNALEPAEQERIDYPVGGNPLFGLNALPIPEGRTVAPMTWMNADFCALMTGGENHLRKQVGFANATQTRLNLGDFDWTVEFWYCPTRKTDDVGVVFEIGQGPRGENEMLTRLSLTADQKRFELFNGPGKGTLIVPTRIDPRSAQWYHLAFSYSAAEDQLYHHVNGKLQPLPGKMKLESLPVGEEAYFGIGRDGLWGHPLPGKIDELRFSAGQIYRRNFIAPKSFSPDVRPPVDLLIGPALLFAENRIKGDVYPIDDRKYLFIDDALIASRENVSFTVNPPRLAECVIDSIQGSFRKHLSIIEDEEGLIRLYYGGPDDYLAVQTSRDGVHWEVPDLGRGEYKNYRNIAIPEPTGMGNMFIDPNAPAEQRWKFISGFHDRGVYVYSSPDGWTFKRHKTAILPFRSGSQSNTFYDEQRQLYVGYHRTDYPATPADETRREFVLTESKDVLNPWPFRPISLQEVTEVSKTKRLHKLIPWYLDNGPLTPGGFGVEYPTVFGPDESLDPVGSDVYVPKALKYPWAPDAYVAFPLIYLHYEGDGPLTRQILMHPDRDRGSGPVETQFAVSRDGVHWRRYPRPTYIGIGQFGNHDIHQSYTAHGLVRRGDEIWQYVFAETAYHSTWRKDHQARAVYRFIQRLDGFVSADAPYDREGIMFSKPIQFIGNRLVLNIDTDAAGYCQVGFIDADGRPIGGFSVDDCIYINGDFIDTQVEWMNNGVDLTPLQGRTVQLVFRMRGCKLYSMQFVRTS